LRPDDQVAVHAPLHFDLPVYDLYVGLAAGATLHLVPERVAFFPQALLRFLTERKVSHLYAVPSALTALVNRSTLTDHGAPARRPLTARSRIELGGRRFYRTGDIARRDEDGVLHLLGRRDGLVKTRGYRVELGEVEAIVGTHPDVAEVAVLAEPDPELTNRLHAVVVPTQEHDDDSELVDRLVRHCRDRLPGYMVPSRIHVLASLPKTSTGKIARAELPDLVLATR